MLECILRELVVMKRLFLIALVALPLTSEAVCFNKFHASGYGINHKTAVEDLEENSNRTCGSDDFNWTQRMSEYEVRETDENTEKPIKASAIYRCCTAW